MNKTCRYQNPLVRNGTHRNLRMPRALDPEFVKVDERSESDILKYILDYSETLQYYNLSNEPSGHWKAFFDKDISSLIALLSHTDISREREGLELLPKLIMDSSDRKTVETAFRGLFELNFSIFMRMNRWFLQIPEQLELHAFMRRLITSGMKDHLHDLAALYKGAVDSPSLQLRADPPDTLHKASYSTWEQFKGTTAGPVWIATPDETGPASVWADIMDAIVPDLESYGPQRKISSVSTILKIRQALPVLETISERCYKTYSNTVHQSSGYLQDSLENYPSHEPHMGLLLAFLRLFHHARNDLNTLTRRHLEFYYKDILRLQPLAAVPDKVFLIAEVAQHLDEARIEKGTMLKAGEDALEKEVLYEVTRDSYLNKAMVSEIKTVYTGKTDKGGIFAAPVANSKDGLGEEFDDSSDGWAPFGQPQPETGRTMGDAQLGFAVASPVLRMAEGKRTIYLIFSSDSGLELDHPPDKLFRAFISAEECWFLADIMELSDEETNGFSESDAGFMLKIQLDNDDPSVVDFDSDLHEGRFKSDAPVLKIELIPDDKDHIYQTMRNYRVNHCRIEVKVEGVHDLILQNDLGRLDPSKPVQPFGPVPEVGSRFLIGSREIFSKNVTGFTLHLNWTGWPAAGLKDYYKHYGKAFEKNDIRVDRLILTPDNWQRVENVGFFQNTVTFTSDHIEGEAPDLKDFRGYQAGMNRGFIGFELAAPEDPFWHKFYRSSLAEFAVDPDIKNPPTEPFSPKLGEIKVDYHAVAEIHLEDQPTDESGRHRFYHLYPFGIDSLQRLDTKKSVRPYLLPQFSAVIDSGTEISDGELFIGLESFKPPQSITLLFAVKEGSEDPELKETAIRWFYLSGNRWKLLKPFEDYRDDTLGLKKTEIITFQIPKDATSGDPLFESDKPLHWIKASVTRQARRFPKLFDIRAQAFPASFTDRNNDPDYLKNPLPAGSISKFKQSRSDVRAVAQHWSALKGKMPEQGNEFYRRISERLRHKDRGVAIHDYERMVLQKFSDIWLAKCINHTAYEFEEPDGRQITAEFAPGYVTMLLVPDLTNQNIMDPLQPRASFSRRREVHDYLTTRLPVFAAEKLSVINPKFEPVRIELTAVFRGDVDAGFYKKKLSNDIQAFLAPWAFGRTDSFRFGTSIHKSMVVNYVDELSYVDYVTEVRMFHKTTGDFREVDEAAASTSSSVLTSANNHRIITE